MALTPQAPKRSLSLHRTPQPPPSSFKGPTSSPPPPGIFSLIFFFNFILFLFKRKKTFLSASVVRWFQLSVQQKKFISLEKLNEILLKVITSFCVSKSFFKKIILNVQSSPEVQTLKAADRRCRFADDDDFDSSEHLHADSPRL